MAALKLVLSADFCLEPYYIVNLFEINLARTKYSSLLGSFSHSPLLSLGFFALSGHRVPRFLQETIRDKMRIKNSSRAVSRFSLNACSVLSRDYLGS